MNRLQVGPYMHLNLPLTWAELYFNDAQAYKILIFTYREPIWEATPGREDDYAVVFTRHEARLDKKSAETG